MVDVAALLGTSHTHRLKARARSRGRYPDFRRALFQVLVISNASSDLVGRTHVCVATYTLHPKP